MNLNGYQQTVSVIRVEKKIEIHHAPVKWFANFARKSLQMTCLGPCPNENENILVLDNHKDIY